MEENTSNGNINNDWSHLNKLSSHNGEDNLHEPENKNKKSIAFWIFIIGFVSIILASLFAYYQYEFSKNQVSSEKILVTSNIKENVRGGEINLININVSNDNAVALKDSKLKVSYQRGFTRQGESDIVNEIYSIGEIKPATYYATSSQVTFIGSEGEYRKYKLELFYSVIGSNAEFVKTTEVTVKINTPSVSLKIESADKVLEENEITYTFKVKNLSLDNFSKSMLVIETPPAFSIKKIDGVDDQKKTIIEKLKVGEEFTKTITGYFKDSVGQSKVMRAYVSVINNDDEIGSSYAENIKEIAVKPYPVQYSYVFKNNNIENDYFETGSDNVLELSLSNVDDEGLTDLNIFLENQSTKDVVKVSSDDAPSLSKILASSTTVLPVRLNQVSIGDYKYKIEIYGKTRGDFVTSLLGKGEITLPYRAKSSY